MDTFMTKRRLDKSLRPAGKPRGLLSEQQMYELLAHVLDKRQADGLPIPEDLPKETHKAINALGALAAEEAAVLAREEQVRQDEIDQLPRPKRLEDSDGLLQQKCADLTHTTYITALIKRRADIKSKILLFKNPCGEDFSDIRMFSRDDWNGSFSKITKQILFGIIAIPFLMVLVLSQTLLEIFGLIGRIADVVKLTLRINTSPPPVAPVGRMTLLGLWRTLVPNDRDLVGLNEDIKVKLIALWIEALFGPHIAYTEDQIAWRVKNLRRGQIGHNIELSGKGMHATFVPAFDVVLKQISAELEADS